MRWFEWCGTVCGVGRVPLAPGTAGSAVAALGYVLLGGPWPVWLAAIVGLTVLGVVAGNAMERAHGHDPGAFVLDEVVGTLVALLGAPPVPWVGFLAFAAFRVFDILKPPPVRQAEALPGGLGIMADDVVAGLMALAVVQLVLWPWG